MNQLSKDILFLLGEFMIKSMNAYYITMRTVLRGSEGPNANFFKDSRVYGKYPELTNEEYEESINYLLDTKRIIKNKQDNGKIYFLKRFYTLKEVNKIKEAIYDEIKRLKGYNKDENNTLKGDMNEVIL